MLKPGVAASASQISNLQTNATAAEQDAGIGSSSSQPGNQNDSSAANTISEIGMNGMPHYGFGNLGGGSARIVDLEEQNNKFAEVDFREMLAIAKDFARGDTGTMRSPSLAPME
ncbi:hypothetical protein FRC09_010484 [Ceratobasidium sp. 395]|nr:hypothetical protein FRC09_010484 [Ceratobasidium sp. 395]